MRLGYYYSISPRLVCNSLAEARQLLRYRIREDRTMDLYRDHTGRHFIIRTNVETGTRKIYYL